MRRVFIQKENGEFVNENAYNAFFGFSKLGYEIEFYEEEPPKDLLRTDIVVGWISSVKKALKNLGITPPTEIDYPQSLNEYYGRKIWKSNLNKISEDDYPVFIKPQIGKYFNGTLVEKFSDMIGFKFDSKTGCEIWCSEPVKFVSEYRVFVRYGNILDARKYKGNPFISLDEKIVEKAIASFDEAPAGYSMDFGVTDDGRCLVIEVNDGYALGSYGLFPTLYAKLISARWSEMTNTIDELQVVGHPERWY
jgi:hypothetical protein